MVQLQQSKDSHGPEEAIPGGGPNSEMMKEVLATSIQNTARRASAGLGGDLAARLAGLQLRGLFAASAVVKWRAARPRPPSWGVIDEDDADVRPVRRAGKCGCSWVSAAFSVF